MKVSRLGEVSLSVFRSIAFGGFIVALLVLTVQQWNGFGRVADWLKNADITGTGIPSLVTFLGESPEVVFGLAFAFGLFVVFFMSPYRGMTTNASEYTARRDNTERQQYTSKGITILLGLGFVFIRGGMLFVYDGSYTEEYLSVFGNPGEVGSGLMALIVQGSLSIWGTYVWAVKLVPVIFSLGSAVLLLVIGKQILRTSSGLTFLMLLYTFTPWLIFQHFYAHSYVIYEFMALVFLGMAFRVMAAIQAQHERIIWIWGSLLVILPLGLHVFSPSRGTLLMMVLVGILLLYIGVLKIQYSLNRHKMEGTGTTTSERTPLPRVVLMYKLIFILVVGTLLLVMFNLSEVVRSWALLNAVNTFSAGQTYFEFFFESYAPITLLFLLSIPLLLFPERERVFVTSTVLTGFLLFIVHLTADSRYHTIRAIIYLLPLIFLGAVFAFERLNRHPGIGVLAPILLISNILALYPDNFFSGPYIPNEVPYVEYAKAYSFAKRQCQDKPFMYAGSAPYIGTFYESAPDYALKSQSGFPSPSEELTPNTAYIQSVNVSASQTDIPELVNSARIEQKTRAAYCYMEHRPDWYTFISAQEREKLIAKPRQTGTVQEFRNITVYVHTEKDAPETSGS